MPTTDAARAIRGLIEKERYRNPEAFMDRAVNILLTWESDRPEKTLEIMKSMMPFTPEQEEFISSTMKEDERKRHFGETETEAATDEARRHAALGISDLDHRRLMENRPAAIKRLAKWSPPKPAGAYKYDGYPMLFKLYTRLLPVKITVAVLGNLLYETGADHVSLDSLRAAAYDIAEELAGILAREEREGGKRRNARISTGLPTKGAGGDADLEKRVHAQKRFKDHYAGRVRKNRETKTEHADGAPAALGLVAIFKEGGEHRVTLTEAGRRLCMMDNPVIASGGGDAGALGGEEAAFILGELVPRLSLENAFVKAAIKSVEKAGEEGATTAELDRRFLEAAVAYARKNKQKAKKFGLEGLEGGGEGARARIVGWRVATMGRLAELGAVVWDVRGGESVFLPGGGARPRAAGRGQGRRSAGGGSRPREGRGQGRRGAEKII